MEWGLRIKEIAYYGGSLKNLIFRVGSQKNNINNKKREVVFLRGLIPKCKLWEIKALIKRFLFRSKTIEGSHM